MSTHRLSLSAVILAMVAPWAIAAAQRTASADWSAVDRAFGRAGAAQADGSQKYSFPRSDLQVMVGATRLRPALALGSWIALKRTSDGAAVAMGDLVLTDDEVPMVMSKLQDGGVEQTALHNHL